MGATDAERQRRYRAHRKGDHSLCDPTRQCDVTPPVTAVTPSEPTRPRLGRGGRRLWDDLEGDQSTGSQRALTVEACRITDRLDKLDRLLSGDADDWLGIIEDRGNPDRQEIVIDKPLAEARQQATALKQILSELRQAKSSGTQGRSSTPPTTAPVATGGKGVAGVADLTARIAARSPQAAG